MPKGSELARAGCPYLGVAYSVMDCQKFVEKCLDDIGLRKDLAGSNAWYRYIMENGWFGSPEECKAKFGRIPEGAFLFILKHNGKEPEKYRRDGIGNASHIGIYTAMTGDEMVALAVAAGDVDAGKFNFGDGAIHSSSTRKAVATSKFAGKTINGGWNRVGLWREVSYGDSVDRLLRGGGENVVPYKAKVIGGGLNLREQPSKNSERLEQIPEGTILDVTDEMQEWAKVTYKGLDGWVMKEFLQNEGDMVSVPRTELEKIYDAVGDWLGLRG